MNQLQARLKHLPGDKISELETVTGRILATGKAEMVILFGSYARGDYKLQKGEKQGKKSDYDLLVITADWDSRKATSLSLSRAFDDIATPVQTIVETITTVNSNLEDWQFFFSDIRREGIVLYNSEKYTLAEPAEVSPEKRKQMAEEDFKMWMGAAKSFWRQYNHAYNDKDFRVGAFNLQQVVEMCYTTIEMVFAHYNPHEHNLYTLRKRVEAFDQRVNDAFPLETDEEAELFEYLNFAYIGGRYRSEEEFPVTQSQLDYWARETEKLLEITERVCKEKVVGFMGIVNHS